MGGANLLPFSDIGEGWTNTAGGVTATYRNGVMHIEGLHSKSGWTNIVNVALWAKNPKRLPSGITLACPATVSGATSIVLYSNVDGVDRNLSDGVVIDSGATALVKGFYIAVMGATNFNFDIPMIVTAGTRPTVYEPYQAQTITIPFGQTVYGGTVDVTEGKLTVDRAKKSEMTRGAKDTSNKLYQIAGLSDAQFWTSTGSAPPIISTALTTLGLEPARLSASPCITQYGSRFYVGGYIGKESELDALLQSLEFVYELATPIVYDLTPTEVTTMLGTNNIWADTGDVTVEYPYNDTSKNADFLRLLFIESMWGGEDV